MTGGESHYDVLGLDRDCSSEQVRAAYHRLALIHHPDRGGERARFESICEAYRVLSDEVLRAEYDDLHPQDGFTVPELDVRSFSGRLGSLRTSNRR